MQCALPGHSKLLEERSVPHLVEPTDALLQPHCACCWNNWIDENFWGLVRVSLARAIEWYVDKTQMPFIKQASRVTFKKPIGSISVSGHKFIGAPMPCGVVITRQKYVMALSQGTRQRGQPENDGSIFERKALRAHGKI